MRRFSFVLAAFCLLAPAQTTTIKVDARLVTVPVTVRDKKGNLVNNLKQKDFEIASDGHAQTIRYFDRDNDLPLTLGLLVDVSMSQRDVLDDEREASSAFLSDMLAPDRDQAFLIQFGSSVDLLTDITMSVPKLQAGLKKVDAQERKPNFRQRDDNGTDSDQRNADQNNSGDTDPRDRRRDDARRRAQQAGVGTAMYDAIFLASDEVIAKQKNRKALILLTDGVDMGSRTSIAGSIEAAQRADTAVYAIYYKGKDGGGSSPMRGIMNGGGPFGGGGRHGGGGPGGGGGQGGGRGQGGGAQRADGKKILERICGETGGRMFEVTKKDTVATIYKQIAEELRNQYRIGFTPSNTEDGYHTLNLTVPADAKLHLQAREGYYVGSK